MRRERASGTSSGAARTWRRSERCGGQQDLQRTPWLAHAVIGIKGAPPGSAVEASGPGNVTASVGRPRTLALTLETFSLR